MQSLQPSIGGGAVPAPEAVTDRFALQHCLPNGKTVLDQFLASWPDLSAADRETLRGWRDPVEGVFETAARTGTRSSCRTSSMTWSTARTPTWPRAASARCPSTDFRATPASFPSARSLTRGGLRFDEGLPQVRCRASGAGRARTGDETARTDLPQSRENREAWKQMQAVRAALVAFFGGDDCPSTRRGRGTDQHLLPALPGSRARRAARPPSATEHPRRGRARVQLPAEFADAIGVITTRPTGSTSIEPVFKGFGDVGLKSRGRRVRCFGVS